MSDLTCLNCGISEQERPLVALRFQEKDFFICPQCLPILIHKPYELTDRLPGFQPSDYPSSLDD
jgi:hypothetical protein